MNIDHASPTALYMQLASQIRAAIRSGELPPGVRLPSELELAERYRLSRGTVRQAMNILVNEELVERVPGKGTFVKAIDPVALIGVILPYVGDALTMDILVGVEQTAKQQNCQVIFAQTEERPQQQTLDIRRMRDQRAAGIILFPLTNLAHDDIVAGLAAEGVPLVLVDRYFPNLATDVVVVDNFDGGRQATEHLIALGHKRIGFIAADSLGTTSIHDRYEGYRRALAAHGLPCDERLFLFLPGEAPPAALGAYLRQSSRPTAVFASNDFSALRVMRRAEELGLRVPEDLAVVGFDNIKEAAELSVPLTTVAQSGRQIGQRACELLLEQLNQGRHTSRHEVLPVKLIVRHSSGAAL
jgi:DNA-binding LacI/PurR family transcriptional regulator